MLFFYIDVSIIIKFFLKVYYGYSSYADNKLILIDIPKMSIFSRFLYVKKPKNKNQYCFWLFTIDLKH